MDFLLVEDDAETRDYLVRGLQEAGHRVTVATSLAEAEVLAPERHWDAMILDRMLAPASGGVEKSKSQTEPSRTPQGYGDGLAFLARLRGRGFSSPVLILSALGAVEERVQGLQRGADDYLAKPFAFSELLARVEALARRTSVATPETTLTYADLELDLLGHRAQRGGRDLHLQPREFRLLECLLRNVERTVTRTMLFEKVWGYHFDAQSGVIDVHVSRLRRKLDKDFTEPLLHTVRGTGYRLALLRGADTPEEETGNVPSAQNAQSPENPPRQEEAESSRGNKPRPEDSSAAR